MSKPYSTTAQVLNPALLTLVSTAQWNRTELTGDVAALISEGDNEIDARLAALEVPLPFATNPAIVQDLSVLYARYACFRDLYAAGAPAAGKGLNPNAQKYLDQFETKMKGLIDGTLKLVDSTGAVIPGTKYATVTVPYPCPEKNIDPYPNYPSGPYPDPPGIGN